MSDARRWVVGLCRDLGREDLVDCAELGVSELVTNAILHGLPPFSVGVRGTRDHPRIEVHDASPTPPVSPTEPLLGEEQDLDEFLTTFGRGLSMVCMASEAWGASIERDGKVVWFVPASSMHDDAYREGVIDVGIEDDLWQPLEDAVPVRLLGVDLKLFLGVQNQYNNLRRELRLLSLAHEADYPLARDLSHMFTTFERQFPPSGPRQVATALKQGMTRADLVFEASPQSRTIFTTMLEMFDLADAFCRAQRLLSLSRTSDQKEFQSWMLGEFIRQTGGEPAEPWSARPRTGASSNAS